MLNNRTDSPLPMNVLMVTDNLFSGGKERRFVELIKGLAGYPEVECEVIVLEKKRNTHYQEIFNLPVKLHFMTRRSRYDLRIFSGIKKISKDFNPRIIHSWGSMSAVYSLPVARLLKKQFVYTISDAPCSLKRFSKIWWRTKLVFPFSTVIAANSKAGLNAYSVISTKGVVIHNGFDFSRLEKLIDPQEVKNQFNIESPHMVGMVAGFRDHKDHDAYFSVACNILDKRDDVTFLVIGEGGTMEHYMNNIEEKYRDRIIFTGGQQIVESLVNILDIGILLTNFTLHGEGISNVIMEYMALGKPVIATKGGGTGEIVMDNETGFLIEKNNKQTIITKILYLLDNPDIASRMGKKGKQRIETDFTIKKMVDRYHKLYDELILNKKNMDNE